MAASFVQEVAVLAGAGTSAVVTKVAAGNTTEGNLLVALAGSGNTASNPVTFSDSKGNTWTKTIELVRATGPQLSVGWCVVAAGKSHVAGTDTFTATWTSTINSRVLMVDEFAGLTASPLDLNATGNGTATSLVTAATATTTQADELLIGAFAATFGLTGYAFTPGATYTQASQSNGVRPAYALTEYRVVSATGGYTADSTVAGTPDGWCAGIITFKAAATGSPTGHLLASAGTGQ